MTEHEGQPKPDPRLEKPGPETNGSTSSTRRKDTGSEPLRTFTPTSSKGSSSKGQSGKRPRKPRAAPPPSRRWMLLAAGGLFVALFAIVVARGLNSGPKLPPRTVEDAEFVRQANAACSRSLPNLREDRARRRTGDEGTEAALAGTVERAAGELERLTGEVRSLPVATGDQADVSRWLDDWDAYVVTGRRFADALRRKDDQSYAAISAESTRLSESIYAFSKANGMSKCVF
jgi:hypothetical protein